MRVNCNTEIPFLSKTHESFDSISKIYQAANSKSNTRLTFNLERASHGDANLAAVCASVSFILGKSENALDLGPKKHGYNKVSISRDMFGFRISSYAFLRLTFWSGGTEVRIFEPGNFLEFNDYLVRDAIRKNWKRQIPYHYMLDAKDFLRKLYENCTEHMGCNDPIFFASSFKDGILSFTVADCGQGFLRQINKVDDEVITEKQAIKWALDGKSIKRSDRDGILKQLGDYCWFNEGSLLVVSGNSSVEYKEDGNHDCRKLSAPMKGSIINFSIKVVMPKFCE